MIEDNALNNTKWKDNVYCRATPPNDNVLMLPARKSGEGDDGLIAAAAFVALIKSLGTSALTNNVISSFNLFNSSMLESFSDNCFL